jgi:hypothetical protein
MVEQDSSGPPDDGFQKRTMTENSETGHTPDAAELRTLAEELIRNQTTMTLATCMNGETWAAPVYYVFHEGGFCFLSNPDSRHIREALESGQASAAIHAAGAGWRDIRGMQMSGRIERISGKMEALRTIGAYLGKFPFTREFFAPGLALDIAAFEQRFRVKLYRFRPSLALYLDNRIRFGFREEVSLS